MLVASKALLAKSMKNSKVIYVCEKETHGCPLIFFPPIAQQPDDIASHTSFYCTTARLCRRRRRRSKVLLQTKYLHQQRKRRSICYLRHRRRRRPDHHWFLQFDMLCRTSGLYWLSVDVVKGADDKTGSVATNDQPTAVSRQVSTWQGLQTIVQSRRQMQAVR